MSQKSTSKDILVLQQYRDAYRKFFNDGIIDLDKEITFNFDFKVYRLEDIISQVNGILPPARQTPYWIALIKSGNGEKMIGQFTFPIQDNMLFVIPKRVIHSSRYDSINCSGYVMNFHLDFFLNQGFPGNLVLNRKIFRNMICPYLHLDKQDMDSISAIFELIIQEQISDDQENREMIAIKVLELLICCDRLFSKNRHVGAELISHPVIERFMELVDKNYMAERSVQYYARSINIHPNHLNFLLKKHTGLTAKQTIGQRIIQESKILLSRSTLPIKDVAHRLGFEDPNNFSTFFQKHTGCSPLMFRNSPDEDNRQPVKMPAT